MRSPLSRTPTPTFPLLKEIPAVIPAVEADMVNPEWLRARFRVLIVRLSRYVDVVKSGSHLFLFSEARRAAPEAYIDFAFLPERTDRDLLDERDLPWFFGRTSQASPKDFDLILISNAFPLELLNLPYLFSTAKLPLRASERRAMKQAPLVILGGSSAALAGSAVFDLGKPGEDSLVDGIFFGEGEGATASIIAGVASALRVGDPEYSTGVPRATSESRGLALESVRKVEGLWLPGFPVGDPDKGEEAHLIRKRIVRPAPEALKEYPVLNSEESDTARLMISAGCPGLCSFCLEGWDRLPYREIPLREILDSARRLRTSSGASTLEVYSFNFNTHESVFELLFELGRIFRRVNFMSQRIDILARTQGLATAEFAAEKRSFTLGIEGISARMRRLYRKGLSGSDISAALDRILTAGLRELKLFFIIAGVESAGDIEEFASFVSTLALAKSARSAGTRLLVSAGYLVRLPFTPLQFAPVVLDRDVLEGIARQLGAICEKVGVEFRIASRYDEFAVDQVLALGGSTLAPWIESLPGLGFWYDASLSRGAWTSLKEFAESRGLLAPAFLDEKTADFRPPLDFMENTARHALLWKHYSEAVREEDRSLCLGTGCSDCGACLDPHDKKAIAGHRNAVLQDRGLISKISRLVAAKNTFSPVMAEFDLPEILAGSTPEYKASWLLRRLSEVRADSWKYVFDVKVAMFGHGSPGDLLPDRPGFWGKCVFELMGPDAEAISSLILGLKKRQESPEGIAGFGVGIPGEPRVAPPSKIELEFSIASISSERILAGFRRWLSESHVEVTERTGNENGFSVRNFDPPIRDLRKGIVWKASIIDGRRETTILLTAGIKAKTGELLDLIDPQARAVASLRIRGWE